MLPPQFEYTAPATIRDAFRSLVGRPDALLVTGTYRQVIDLKLRRITPGLLVDLHKIPDLFGLTELADSLRIGALTTLRVIMDEALIRARYTALAEAAAASGDAQMRNMESLGASFTYDLARSDTAAALLVLNAVVHVADMSGERTASAGEFFERARPHGEIVTAITLPEPPGRSAYEKFKHPATLSVVCGVAVSVTPGGDGAIRQCAVAVAGASARPQRLPETESALLGKTLNAETIARVTASAGEQISFVADREYSALYRAQLLKALLKRALHKCRLA
jgi:carbon-monoxide dehydrogenase medium subunit